MKSLKLETKNFKISTIIYLTFLLVIFLSTEVNGKKSGKNSNVIRKIINEKANEIGNEDFVIGSRKSSTQIGKYNVLKNTKLENVNDLIKSNSDRSLKVSNDKDNINTNEDFNKSSQEKSLNTKSLKLNSFNDSNKDDNISNSDDEFKTIESGTLFSLTVTFFIAGFGDKSFFIATIASIRYNKIVCILASFLSLVLMGIFSVFLGIEISAFVAPWIIDLFSSILFILMGVKMIIEGIETSEDLHFMKLNEDEKTITKASEKLLNEENNNKNINDKINEQNKNFLDEKENGDVTISSKETAVESQNEKLIFEISSNYEEEELIKSKTSKKLERQFEKDFKEYQKLEKSLLQSIDTSLTIEEKAELIQKLKEESK